MADETQPGLFARPLTIETGIAVGGRGVRVIGSMLSTGTEVSAEVGT
jgi:hypothetical protein